MTLQVWFWVLYVVSLVFSFWAGYGADPGNPYPYKRWGGNLLFYLLIGILGWATFGSPVK